VTGGKEHTMGRNSYYRKGNCERTIEESEYNDGKSPLSR
jgi:hypothetical protein